MEERPNSFKDLEREYESRLPRELEVRVSSQTNNFSVFGRVVELFMPNALQTVVRLIGGPDDGPDDNLLPGRRPRPEEWPDWRTPPGSTGPPPGRGR